MTLGGGSPTMVAERQHSAPPYGQVARAKGRQKGVQIMGRRIRLAAVSFSPAAKDLKQGQLDLTAIGEMARQVVAMDRPDFICFPEICACGGDLKGGVANAPEVEAFTAEVGKLARELKVNLVIPFLEKFAGRVYNSVPIVDRSGTLKMVYRKNFPTTGEMEHGVSPGWEVPVAECDGVRVGAAVCFDLNYSEVAEQLEKQRAQLVFWPTMFWGGKLLEHWTLRYGFAMVAAFGVESAIVDMNGTFLAKQGQDTWQVRGGRLSPWAVADINVERELFHLDFNQNKFAAMRKKYGADIKLEIRQPEAYFLLSSERDGLTIDQLIKEFELEPLRDYLARSARMRDDHLRGHPEAAKLPPRTGPMKDR